MVFSGKEGIQDFFGFLHQMCTTLLICISNYAFLVCFKYKCLKMPYSKLFIKTSLAQCVQRNIGLRSFCTNLAIRDRSIQKRPRSDISL